MTIDGVQFVFQLAPDTEAPAEMHFYLPQLKLLCPAENCSHNLHNVYTLRGAKIRDALAWSKALNETLERWGDKSEVMLNVHHWPVGAGSASSTASRSKGTCTATSTTRPCGWPTRATP